MAYAPRNVPSDPAQIADFLRSELQRIASELSSAQALLRIASTATTPEKPRTGDIRLADGSNWNPVIDQAPTWYDGSDWRPFATSHPVGTFVSGKPSASEIVLRYVAVDPFTLPAALAGSKGDAGTAATAQTDFDVRKGASSIGTVRFAASGTTATLIAATETAFSVGDVLSVVAPSSADATLANISITLRGVRD